MALEEKIQQALGISVGANLIAINTVSKPYDLTKGEAYKVDSIIPYPNWKNPNMVYYIIKDNDGEQRRVPYFEFDIRILMNSDCVKNSRTKIQSV